MCQEPRLTIYHDLVTAAEIRYMKAAVLRDLMVATTVDTEDSSGDGKKVSNERTQSSGWLYDQEHPLVLAVSRKVSLLSGLETVRPEGAESQDWVEAEAWQLGLYGAGGHYLPHHDAFPPDSLPQNVWKEGLWVGNR